MPLKCINLHCMHLVSIGCFNQTNENIIISRSAEGYHIEYGKKSKKLTPSELTYIRTFESELLKTVEMGCTTVDTYTLTYNNVKVTKTDGSCNWNGKFQLMKQLGLHGA